MKYFKIWALKTKQILIASNSYINELKQGVKLLIRYLFQTIFFFKCKVSIKKPKFCR